MKSFRRHPVSVNTGSMADIAFLLLIFFLVSTTISAEKGILRHLPAICDDPSSCEIEIKEENILKIIATASNAVLISDKSTNLSDIKKIVKDFIDNNGSNTCDYCKGKKRKDLSEHPTKAVVEINFDSAMMYSTYITIQNEINAAYSELRTVYAMDNFKMPLDNLTSNQLNQIKEKYPIKVVDKQVDYTLGD